jgi:hypothetical protein
MRPCEIDLDLCQFVTKTMSQEDVQAVYDALEAGCKMKGFLGQYSEVTDTLGDW